MLYIYIVLLSDFIRIFKIIIKQLMTHISNYIMDRYIPAKYISLKYTNISALL